MLLIAEPLKFWRQGEFVAQIERVWGEKMQRNFKDDFVKGKKSDKHDNKTHQKIPEQTNKPNNSKQIKPT